MLISFFIIYPIFICKYEKDEKLAKLAPLMAKFEKVTLNIAGNSHEQLIDASIYHPHY